MSGPPGIEQDFTVGGAAAVHVAIAFSHAIFERCGDSEHLPTSHTLVALFLKQLCSDVIDDTGVPRASEQ